MTPKHSRGPIDPDSYQKRDFKRRLTATEEHLGRVIARLQRLEGRFLRRMTHHEAQLALVAAAMVEEE